MFTLNEAPDLVLNAIKVHKTDRCCGLFWMIACALPTCGFIFCVDDEADRKSDFWGCCCPKMQTTTSTAMMKALKETIISLRITPETLQSAESKEELNRNMSVIIQNQVKNTITVLQTLLTQSESEPVGFRNAIKNVGLYISSRAKQEQKLAEKLDHPPFTGFEIPTPDYGFEMTEKKQNKK